MYPNVIEHHLHHERARPPPPNSNPQPSLTTKNIGARDIGAFLQSLDGLEEVSRLKLVNLSDNRVGAKGEGTEPVDTLLLASRSSLTALNFRG